MATGVVTASALNVRKTPSMDGKKIGSLKRNAIVTIRGEQPDWFQIDFNAAAAWVSSRYIALDPTPQQGTQAPVVAPPAFDGPLSERPRNRKEVIEMFGDPTRGNIYKTDADPTWKAHNIVSVHGPKAFLPVLESRYFPVHEDIEPYAREAFKRAEAAAPGYIQKAGTWGYNFRHMRHDINMPLSYHSWGIAIDINPDSNKSHTFDDGETPEPWSAAWVKRWPRGVPKGVVLAFKSCGFAWGGNWKGFVDPMHFEWLGQSDVQV